VQESAAVGRGERTDSKVRIDLYFDFFFFGFFFGPVAPSSSSSAALIFASFPLFPLPHPPTKAPPLTSPNQPQQSNNEPPPPFTTTIHPTIHHHPPPPPRLIKGAATAVAGLALTLAANADATVKLGADSGALVFDPASVTIKAGDTLTFKNNAGFPHNIVFDEDAVPSGVNAEALSHEEYLNAPGETYSLKLAQPGRYLYYCEPHQGAGMAGTIIVE